MAELQDLDGVGPAREESLKDAGYEDVASLADADHEELAEEADVPEDTALEFVVQAQNIVEPEDEDEGEEFDLTPKDVSDEVEEPEEDEEDEEDDEEEVEPEPEPEPEDDDDDGPENYPLELSFDSRLQYHTYHAALMSRWCNVYTSRQPAADALKKCLDGLDSYDSVEYDLTERELNELHSAVSQKVTQYQGDNLIDHMDALQEVENELNAQRSEHLF